MGLKPCCFGCVACKCLFWLGSRAQPSQQFFWFGVCGNACQKVPGSRAETPTLFVLPPCARSFHIQLRMLGWFGAFRQSEPMSRKLQSGLVSIRESRSRGGGEYFASRRRHRPQVILVVLLCLEPRGFHEIFCGRVKGVGMFNAGTPKVRRTEPRDRRIYCSGALRRTRPVRLEHLRYHEVWCWLW